MVVGVGCYKVNVNAKNDGEVVLTAKTGMRRDVTEGGSGMAWE